VAECDIGRLLQERSLEKNLIEMAEESDPLMLLPHLLQHWVVETT
jgi:hypothetical protein